VTVFPEVVQSIVAFSLRPDESKPGGIDLRREKASFLQVIAEALGLPALRVVETGGDSYEVEREQWDDGNNVVALEPAWSSATTATPSPTRCYARLASKSSPSAPANWVVAAAAVTA